jgi:3-oxoacyl-[acyl-carrier protein] reductase
MSSTSQVVIITGAGAGIGLALCKAYAQAGATVALNDLSPSLAKQAAQQINDAVGREAVLALPFDVADVPAMRQAVSDVALRFGRLDVAIANAGLTNYGAFLDYTPEAFDRLTGVNLRGSYFFAQAAAREMVAREQPGRIVLMSSATGNRAFLNLSAYGTTKAGLQHMARTLALELGPHNITVNAIAPGAILTERTLKDDPMFAENWAGVTPIKRSGTVEDVAAMVQFLTSPAAQFVNGQTLIIDGGWSLSSPLPDEHPEQPDAGSKLI